MHRVISFRPVMLLFAALSVIVPAGAASARQELEITPGELFAYRLTRSTFDNALRWAFDLSKRVEAPPAPWGYEGTVPTH
jgi:hypothetical protein